MKKLLLLLAPLPAFCIDIMPIDKYPGYTPWFTGPQLAPTPVNIPPGHPAIEPSVTIFSTYGNYTSKWQTKRQPTEWSINPTLDFQFGITKDISMEIFLSSISNFQSGQTASHLEDTYVSIGYQISNDTLDSWVPDFRIILQELFPTGKYQKLNPKKNNIDSTGEGSYQTGLSVAFQKLFHLSKSYFSLQGSIDYYFPTMVKVKGLNNYGGGEGTRGKVRPGQTTSTYLSGQYSFDQHWVFAFDTVLIFQRASHFSGKRGDAPVGLPPFLQISAAPAIEYNFSLQSGLLFGT